MISILGISIGFTLALALQIELRNRITEPEKVTVGYEGYKPWW